MDHSPVRGAKATRNVAPFFLQTTTQVDDFEVTGLLKRGGKMLAEETTDGGIRQSARSEVLGVVSRELLTCEVAGD